MLVETKNLSGTRILSIERETKPTVVYNLEVEGNHNYFVGEIGVLSHNCEVLSILSKIDISAINKPFSNGSTMFGKDVSTVLANASWRNDAVEQAASVIRDIAGGHLFQNGNKRTAQATVELLGVKGISGKHLRQVIDEVSKGNIKTVEDIATALRGK